MFRSIRVRIMRVTVSKAASIAAHDPTTGALTISPKYFKSFVILNRRMLEFFGDVPLSSIKPSQYVEFCEWLASRDVKAVTLNTQLRKTQSMFRRLHERGYVSFDCAGMTPFVPAPRPEPKSVPEHVIMKLVEICTLRDRAMIMLALRSGIRRQTLARLKVKHCRIWQNENGRYRFAARIGKEKTSAPRLIFADHDAALLVFAYLETRPHDSEFVFCKVDSPEPLATNTISVIWRRAVERAGMSEQLAGGAWHRLRHMFAQSKLSTGNDARIVAEWMGIDVETLLRVYATPTAERQASQFFGEDVSLSDWST